MNVKLNENSNLDRVLSILNTKRRLILTIALLLALFLPISSEKRNNLNILSKNFVTTWVVAINEFYTNAIETGIQLVDGGVDRTFSFVQNMLDFYIGLSKLDFSVIANFGFILSTIYILIPVLIIYVLYRITKSFQKKGEDSFSDASKSGYFSPKKSIFLLLIVPFPEDSIWIGAGFGIALFLYWYLQNLIKLRRENKNSSLLELISWKYSLLLIFILILLGISVLSQFSNEDFSVSSWLGISPNTIMIGVIVFLFFLGIFWIFFQARLFKKSPLVIIREKYDENMTPKRITYIIIGILFLISFMDTIIIQYSTSSFVYFFLNLPWLIGLLFHDPLELFLSFVTVVKVSFDLIIDASREIFNLIIPPIPTNVSILGALQSTLWITLLLLLGFLFIYTTYLIFYYLVKIEKVETPFQPSFIVITTNTILFLLTMFGMFYSSKSFLVWLLLLIVITINLTIIFMSSFRESWGIYKKFKGYFIKIVGLIALFLFVFIFDSKNYQLLFDDLYNIQTESINFFVVAGISLTMLLLIVLALYWGYLQIKKGRRLRIVANTIFINGLVIIIATIMIIPFIWMLKNSFQTNAQNTVDFLRQGLIPDPFTTRNYAQLFGIVDPPYETLDYRVVTWLFNSFIAAFFVTMFLVFFSAMAGYVLAKRHFVGRRLLFTLTIAIMMVPPYVQIIPLYLELNRLGFVGSLLGVIFPFLIQPFSIFLATEFMRGIPEDYLDAARVDGYSEFEIFRKIVLPLSIPVISVMIIINLIANWNSFMWPLLLLEQSQFAPQLRTLPLGIYKINGELQEQIGVILALATLIVLPIFIILFLAQDYIKKGVTVEGLKG